MKLSVTVRKVNAKLFNSYLSVCAFVFLRQSVYL